MISAINSLWIFTCVGCRPNNDLEWPFHPKGPHGPTTSLKFFHCKLNMLQFLLFYFHCHMSLFFLWWNMFWIRLEISWKFLVIFGCFDQLLICLNLLILFKPICYQAVLSTPLLSNFLDLSDFYSQINIKKYFGAKNGLLINSK